MTFSTPSIPSLWLRLLAGACRSVPEVRGRARLENALHRHLSNRGWSVELPVNGHRMRLMLDGLQGRAIYMDGVFERSNTEMMRYLVGPGDTIFDGGANEGYYSLLFSDLVGARGRVYAFEPVTKTADILRHNLSLNAELSPRVVVCEFALSDHDGEVLMNLMSVANFGQCHVVPFASFKPCQTPVPVVDQVVVPSRTLDSWWRELGQPQVDLVKLDLEAHELHALNGSRALLAESPNLKVMVEVKAELLATVHHTPADVFAFMRSTGYHAYDFNPHSQQFLLNDTPRVGELILFARSAPLSRLAGS